MSTSLLAELAGVTAALAAAPALTAEVLSAVQKLADVCEQVLQQSRLLQLPPELLLRVLRELDAKALAKLGVTMRHFPLLDRACDEAAKWQHGQLAALRPQRLTAPRRLFTLEEAIEQGSEWGSGAAYSVRDGYKFAWPGCVLFNEDVGKFHLAVIMSGSTNGTVKRMAEHPDTQTSPLGVDHVHKAAINLAARLAAGGESGCGIVPMARENAVSFLAAQLCNKDKDANVTFVRRTAKISNPSPGLQPRDAWGLKLCCSMLVALRRTTSWSPCCTTTVTLPQLCA